MWGELQNKANICERIVCVFIIQTLFHKPFPLLCHNCITISVLHKKRLWKAETKFCPYTIFSTPNTYIHSLYMHPPCPYAIYLPNTHAHSLYIPPLYHTHASWSCSPKTLTHTETAMREQKSKQRTSLTSAKVKNGKTMIQILCIWTDSPSLCQTWTAENSLLK